MATEADIAHGIKIMAAAGLGVPEGWRGLSGSEIARLTAPLLADVPADALLVAAARFATEHAGRGWMPTVPAWRAAAMPRPAEADADTAWGLCRRLRDEHVAPPLPPGESLPWPLADDKHEAQVRWACILAAGGLPALRADREAAQRWRERWRERYAHHVETARQGFREIPSRFPGVRPVRQPVSAAASTWAATANVDAAWADLRLRIIAAGDRAPQDPTQPTRDRPWTLPEGEHDAVALHTAILAVGWREIIPASETRESAENPAAHDASVSARAAAFRRAYEAGGKRAAADRQIADHRRLLAVVEGVADGMRAPGARRLGVAP